jgi:DNA-3-methyladenine glycosylase II
MTLRPLPPFRLDLTVWALRRRARNVVDSWERGVYRRALWLEGGAAELEVSQDGELLRVGMAGPSTLSRSEAGAVLGRMLGTQIDLAAFYRTISRDPDVAPLARRFLGVKPPRFPSVFEALLNGISCQQISLTAGIAILSRLVSRFGARTSGGRSLFPRPQDLAGRAPSDLRRLGYSGSKASAILGIARDAADARVDLEAIAALGDAEATGVLRALPGIGPWTADYVLLRGLGRLGVFPSGDVGAARGLARLLGTKARPEGPRLGRLLARWAPYAGMVYFHLLLDRLSRSGEIA